MVSNGFGSMSLMCMALSAILLWALSIAYFVVIPKPLALGDVGAFYLHGWSVSGLIGVIGALRPLAQRGGGVGITPSCLGGLARAQGRDRHFSACRTRASVPNRSEPDANCTPVQLAARATAVTNAVLAVFDAKIARAPSPICAPRQNSGRNLGAGFRPRLPIWQRPGPLAVSSCRARQAPLIWVLLLSRPSVPVLRGPLRCLCRRTRQV